MRLFKKKEFFTEAESEEIVEAIREAERMTSGEVRLFVEHRCQFVNAMDRALEVFAKLQMQQTQHRNGVLVYIAIKDRQFAILGDEGIHQKVGENFWKGQAAGLRNCFREGKVVEGIARCIREIGASLQHHFPYESDDDNELPDNIVYGK
ncbi:MAG TPA: TPM domain-containing protein [Chitinophagaceae bacterium]|nr:TPM domain-containing protein [Chitinophagaceae bacterium]